MVQYLFTPWRHRDELLIVRKQFYGARASSKAPGAEPTSTQRNREHGRGPAATPAAVTLVGRRQVPVASGGNDGTSDVVSDTRKRGVSPYPAGTPSKRIKSEDDSPPLDLDRHEAIGRVSMWVHRGGCPHMVESTALLMAAVLIDEEVVAEQIRGEDFRTAAKAYAVRAAYAAAFSRFVTGLLDGHQDKLRKQSMYSLAKTIGLPATFVELRHQSTHEPLPSQAKLRTAARQALEWIWKHYWSQLDASLASTADASSTATPSRSTGATAVRANGEGELDEDAACGWSRHQGTWRPKPRGVVHRAAS